MFRRASIFIAPLWILFVLSAQAVENGKEAPEFSLMDNNGAERTLSDYRGKYVVLEWLNHGCPFVKKHYNMDYQNMQGLQKEFTAKGVIWLSIISSAEGKQGFMSAEQVNEAIREKKASPTAVLFDPDGKVGRLYGAKTTPHMYIIDPEGKLIYQGAIDDNSSFRAATIKKANNYVRLSLNESMSGKPVSNPVTKPYGCSVKYK
jgi:peroxiredoxin